MPQHVLWWLAPPQLTCCIYIQVLLFMGDWTLSGLVWIPHREIWRTLWYMFAAVSLSVLVCGSQVGTQALCWLEPGAARCHACPCIWLQVWKVMDISYVILCIHLRVMLVFSMKRLHGQKQSSQYLVSIISFGALFMLIIFHNHFAVNKAELENISYKCHLVDKINISDC